MVKICHKLNYSLVNVCWFVFSIKHLASTICNEKYVIPNAALSFEDQVFNAVSSKAAHLDIFQLSE